MLKKLAPTRKTPPDWLYVHNFDDADAPVALSVKAGEGKRLKKALDAALARLQAELPKAVAADYYMNALASSAKKRGDGAAAVAWNAKAYDTAKGPATKLQWGATWIGNLTDLTPKDTAAIDKAVSTYLDGLKGQPEVFYERNTRSLAKTGAALARWAKAEKQDALLKQFRSRLQGVCDTLPAGDAQRRSLMRGRPTSRWRRCRSVARHQW